MRSRSPRSALLLISLAACSGDRGASVLTHPALAAQAGEPLRAEEAKVAQPPDRSIELGAVDASKLDGLSFTASPVTSAPPAAPTSAAIEALSEADVRALLERLPPIQTAPEDEQSFAMREGPKPPDRTGATIQAAFPPPENPSPPTVKASVLDVLRMQPQGPVDIAGHVSITFSQPMVAVETDDALAKERVPASLEPEPPGQWRWAGTKTLLFEAKPRFPMATEYTVSIPAGTASALGAKTDEPRTYRFATPPPRVISFQPTGEGQLLDPLMQLTFDQRVDPIAVLATVDVRANGRKVQVRLAGSERIAREIRPGEGRDRMVIFEAARPFAKDTAVEVIVGPGTPSAEGPLRTKAAAKHALRTYGPFRYVEHRCEWSGECEPQSAMVVRFNNPIETERDQTSLISVSPKPPDLKIELEGLDVRVTGRFLPEAKHTVTVGAGLTDVYGQKLGRVQTATFRFAKARPMLYAPGDRFVVLEPAGLAHPTFPIYSVGARAFRLRMFAVEPTDWHDFLRWAEDDDGSAKAKPPGKKISDGAREVKRAAGALATTQIELAPALTEKRGNVVIEVEPIGLPPKEQRYFEKMRRWIQVTDLGLDAVLDHEDLYAFATTLADGRPLSGGAEISIVPAGVAATADPTGFARLPLPATSGATSSLLIVRHQGRQAFLPESQWSSSGSSWVAQKQSDSYRFFLFDDRGLYRPGETVSFKGWIRKITGGKTSDVASIDGFRGPLHFEVRDSRNVELAKGDVELSALGGFSFSAELPKNVNLGWARAELRAKGLGDPNGVSGSYAFQIEEFRRPEFEVGAQASEGPHLVGQWAEVEVEAKYYSGGPLGDAAVRWDLIAQPAYYSPPNRDEYSFGIWTPWWGHYDFDGERAPQVAQHVEAKTGGTGVSALRLELRGVNPPRAMTLTAHASVMDLNRQAWAASTSLLVHPASVYAGLKPARSFFVLGQKIAIEAIRVDLEGKIAPGSLELRAAPVGDAGADAGEAAEVCTRTVSDAPVACEFAAATGGPWRISAVTKDERGRPTRSERVVWVAGGPPPKETKLEQQRVELVPDRDRYAIGDTAELLVRTPFAPAEGVLTLRRQGVLRAERISLPEGSAVVRVPIEESQLPNLAVQVDAVGAANGKPAYATGSISLAIPPVSRTLTVELTPEEAIVEPGDATRVRLTVKDANGAAVEGAEAAVYVVDEAVLALARYQTPNPIPTFYPTRSAGTTDLHLRSEILVPAPPELELSRRLYKLASIAVEGRNGHGAKRSEMAEENFDGAPPPAPPPPPPGAQIKVRRNFSPLAVFAPEVKTDREGRATVELTMPDNLTRYRLMAVAVAGGKSFGSAESVLTAKKALMVRPSPPRFLSFGDRFELPVVVQNQTNREIPAAVFVRASNATFEEAQGRLVRVPPQGRALVSFPARAARPGTARFQVGIAAGGFDDAAELSLPVWTPATTEAFATYGEIDQGAIRQPVEVPADVEKSFGALEVTASSTQLQALTDALIYIYEYPYGCSEQIASRVLSIAALRDVLAAFESDQLPPAAEIEAAVGRDLKRLEELQGYDGGWGFWSKTDRSWPFTSIHAMHALVRARDKGFAVPEQMIATGHRYLRSIEQQLPPRDFPPSVRQAIEAYALYVRALMGDLDQNKASALLEKAGGVEKVPLEVLGWLYPVLSDSSAKNDLSALRRVLDNRASETAGTAHFATSYEEGGAYLVLHSDRRADALLLEGLIRDQPNSTLIPKLVRGLLAHRTAGRWQSTQESAWVLLALDRYFRTYEKATPNFAARAWIGDRFAGEHAFKGRTTERHQIEVPMAQLIELGGKPDLVVSKEGEGRLYYRIGLRYAPADLKLAAKSRGFEVDRIYEAIDDPKDVSRDPDGSWRIRAGARVRVRLTMTSPGRRYHVALVDPLPAGLEPQNPALGMSDAAVVADDRPWWMSRWYGHQNLRDERAEAFATVLEGGVHGYAYVARATTVGTFTAAPAHAEEMYAPETFGRSKSDRVVVE